MAHFDFFLGSRGLTATLALALGGLAIAACSSDNNSKPSETPVIGDGGESGDAGEGAGGKANSGGAGGKAGGGGPSGGAGGKANSGGAGGSLDDGGAGGASPGDSGTGGEQNCDRDPVRHDCYPCAPTTTEEFLNHCPTAGVQCTPFDNAARLPQWNGGDLPEVPQ